MNLFTWLSFGSGRNQPDDATSRAIAEEQITIDWHEADKQRTRNWIAERKALAAQKRPELSSDGARYWFDLGESDEINRLEQSLQWNDGYVNSQNNIFTTNASDRPERRASPRAEPELCQHGSGSFHLVPTGAYQ